MAKKKVTVKGGSTNYYIEDKYGKYIVFRSSSEMARVGTMEDALTLIKSDSGKDIKTID